MRFDLGLTKREEKYIIFARESGWSEEILDEKNIGVAYLRELKNVENEVTNFFELSTMLRRLNLENKNKDM